MTGKFTVSGKAESKIDFLDSASKQLTIIQQLSGGKRKKRNLLDAENGCFCLKSARYASSVRFLFEPFCGRERCGAERESAGEIPACRGLSIRISRNCTLLGYSTGSAFGAVCG